MKRGTRTFQYLLFTENAGNQAEPERRRPGRDAILVQKRNELIAHRYYYYVKIARKNYEDTLAALVNEFFVGEYQIVNRIIANAKATLSQLKEDAPNVAYFRKKYPYMVWE